MFITIFVVAPQVSTIVIRIRLSQKKGFKKSKIKVKLAKEAEMFSRNGINEANCQRH